ncbi:EamA family transporter [Desulfosporosinus meridiei]|uniref:Putative permease, DMT superfamily n=1 Tax=Desulfosporosinus meridiei (strain ATCC BAA-275 / DSM 13257 / KCTC 12902 / NCIMB 13706 / S10) TaxID=768704 RepID=J7IZG5_DESMD|nr:DMT family transporter [Desulfosporosinus meridiei]AFQ44101.1 putative permease, DMT superfamily [Desulfosporosinus meridiei DSM 13257]
MINQKESTGLAVLLILISTFGFSLYPILGKVVFGGGAGLSTVLFVRFSIASLIFWAITIWREGFPRMPLKTWLILWGMGGVGYSMMAGLYISSVLYIPASLAALLLYAYPVIVTIIAVLTKQEEFSLLKLAGLIIATFGLVLVLGIALEGINYLGVILALSAAFVYSFYIIVGNKLLKTTTPLVSTSVISTSAAFTYGLIGLPIGGTTWNLSWGTWLGIGGIVLFSTILAMLTFFEGIKRMGPTSASIISTTEPVMTVILAVVIFNENITLWQALGGGFVIMGGILAVLSPARKRISPVDPSAL